MNVSLHYTNAQIDIANVCLCRHHEPMPYSMWREHRFARVGSAETRRNFPLLRRGATTVIFPTKKLVVPVESLDWPDWRGEADLYLIAHADLNIVPVTRTEMLKSMILPKTEPKKSTESGSPPRLLRGLRGGEFCTICPLFVPCLNFAFLRELKGVLTGECD
jgi:hypothetical protein